MICTGVTDQRSRSGFNGIARDIQVERTAIERNDIGWRNAFRVHPAEAHQYGEEEVRGEYT